MDVRTQPVAMIGGVHGAGKTRLARGVCAVLGAQHVVASELLDDRSPEKRVRDVDENQRVIIDRLESFIRAARKPVVIDGHFALVVTRGTAKRVPLRFFQSLALKALVVVAAPIKKVEGRLRDRGGSAFESETLQELGQAEIENAREVSAALGIPLLVTGDSDNVKEVVTFLRRAFS